MFVNPEHLTKEGKKQLRISINQYPPDYSNLKYNCFKDGGQYYVFKEEWETRKVLREFFKGSGVEEQEYPEKDLDDWWGITAREEAIYGSIARIVLDLRNRIWYLEDELNDVKRELPTKSW